MSGVPFVDLKAQYRSIREEVRAAIDATLEEAHLILGPVVERFERDFAAYLGVRNAVGVGTGLDALRVALEVCGVGADTEVIVPAHTFVATALAVSAAGATPRFVDCRGDTFLIDPDLIESAITPRTRAIMPVHLYGQSADMATILALADKYDLAVVEDAAQAHGTRFEGKPCGTLGRAGCFSFYPTKNLGAYGDGGMVVTNDDELAERIRRLCNYGQSSKYVHVEKGGNSRLDSLQAAILGVKLRHLDQWNEARGSVASRYSERLAGSGVTTPSVDPRSTHAYHLYVVRSSRRDELQKHLADHGIQTLIHYPIPIHLQEAYRDLGLGPGSFPVAERLAHEVLSLPMYPELTDAQIDFVVTAVEEFEH
jgi:dTDP-4-amino-4,6-dideoxygalactose transaminase